MANSKINISFIVFLSIILLIPAICSSESIKDGVLMRENGSITLKNGSVIKCNSFWWAVSTADFIQCDKGKRCMEFPVDDVDIGKTFGPNIAEEYAESEANLKKKYEKKRKERVDETIQVKSSLPTPAVEKPDVKNSQEKAAAHSTKARISRSASKPAKSGGKAADKNSDCERKLKQYRAQMSRYCGEAEMLKQSLGHPPRIPGGGGRTIVSQDTADKAKNYAQKRFRIDELERSCNYYKDMVKKYEAKCK